MKPDDQVNAMLARMFATAKAQFGNAIKSHWFYNGDACPGCGGKVTLMKVKGDQAVSLNAFIHRKPGVLIGYLLCERCAKHIFQAAQRNPYTQTPLHTTIEQTLIKAYERYINSLDA